MRAVVGILQRGDRLLVGQRPVGKPYSGYWEFPGGKIEINESAYAALKRELHEELGIEVIAANLLFEHAHTYPDTQVHLEVWQVDKFSGEPESRENQLLRWASIEEIKELKILEGNWPIIEKIKGILI